MLSWGFWVRRTIERIDAPGRVVVDKIVSRCAFGVGFLADKPGTISKLLNNKVHNTNLCEGYFLVISPLMKASTSVNL